MGWGGNWDPHYVTVRTIGERGRQIGGDDKRRYLTKWEAEVVRDIELAKGNQVVVESEASMALARSKRRTEESHNSKA